MSIPHFDYPLRYVNGAPVVNEQGSPDDIAACVTAILLTPPDSRDELPDFGFTDPAFSQEPISPSVLVAQISEWEPRVNVLAEVAPDLLDAAIVNADIELEVAS